jgi:O-antigen/teichoic acid export membrane protein
LNKKKIASFALGPIASAILGFISLPIITWFYSSEDIGRIAMLQVISSMCVLLFSLGLDQSYVRDYHESQNKPLLLKAALTPGFILLLLSVTGCLLWPNVLSSALFKVDNFLISALVAICLVSTFVSRFLSLILRMQEKGLAFSLSQVLPKLLFLIIIGAYVLFSCDFELLHLIIAQTASIVLVTVLYAWNTRSHWLSALGQPIDRQQLKSMLAFGTPLILSGLASWGLLAMGRLFLRHYSSFDQLGIYSVASSFAAAAILVQSIFSTLWAPTVYKWAAAGINADKINEITDQVLALVVLLFAFTGLFSWLVVYFLPAKYSSVQYIMVSCMSNPLFYTLSETTGVGLGIMRRSMLMLSASLVSALINLLGCYLFVPSYGAAGAAISSAIAYWVFLLLRTELSSRAWHSLPRTKLYVFTSISLTMAILFTIAGKAFHNSFFIIWFLVLIVAVVSFKETLRTLFYSVRGIKLRM